ncbi:MAG TPA: NUDIX hydrolase [Chloroflexota bacterium]|nr:NUDIX hydrolase [Chloroflexota bacterium]
MDNEQPRFYFANNHRHYRYCPHCATPLETVLEGLRPRPSCANCGFVQYLNPPLAATILLPRGDRVLMARRTIEPRRGYWTLPGGYVELGESAEEAVVREAKEEVGVDVRVERLLGLHSGAPSAVAVALFLGSIVRGEPEPLHEVDQVGFFAVHELPEIAFWSTHWALDRWAAEQRLPRPADRITRRPR